MKLTIGKYLSLPLEAATETAAILGRRGSGKTHTAVVLAEEMLAAGVQVVILDPLDVWWGLRVGKDGRSTGVPIYVCGGSHADVPLTADAGRVLADAVVDRGLSIVLSLRHLSKTDQRRFVGDFCERIYDRKADPKHRTALHVFLDEADAFVPQRLVPGSERCFGAVDTMVRRGRSSGLAVTLISQRPQVINKDVLSQTEVLITHQLTGPQDRKALQAWIDANDTDNRSAEFMASLASLDRGTAWFWSPGLLKVFARVAVRDRHTFDSSATPKAGVSAVASPKAFATVDLEQLTADIAATIAKAKADDPRELRKQLAEATQMLVRQAKAIGDLQARTPSTKETIVETPVLKDAQIVALDKALGRLEAAIAKASDILSKPFAGVREQLDTLTTAVKIVRQPSLPLPTTFTEAASRGQLAHVPLKRDDYLGTDADKLQLLRAKFVTPSQAPGITPAKQRILNALAFLHGIGVPSPEKAQVALVADTSPNGGAFNNNLGALRSSGLIDYPRPGLLMLTEAGSAIASVEGVPRTSEELHATLRTKLPPAKWRIVEALIQAYPDILPKAELAARAGASASGGAFSNNLGSLRTLGLLDYPQPGTVQATAVLFLEAR